MKGTFCPSHPGKSRIHGRKTQFTLTCPGKRAYSRMIKTSVLKSVYEEFDVTAPEDGWHGGFEGAVGLYQ